MLLSAITKPVGAQAYPFVIVNKLLYHHNFDAIRMIDLIPGAMGGGVLTRYEDRDLIQATW